MQNKSTLQIYRSCKTKIQEESWIDNSYGSMLLTRARTNTLKLNWRNRHTGGEENCPSCGVVETLEHFLLHCKDYSTIRSQVTHLQQPYPEDARSVTANLLFHNTNQVSKIQEVQNYLKRIWQRRKVNTENN